MQKLLLITVVALFTFTACQKGASSTSASNENTFSATIDGKDESFNNILVATNGTLTAGAYQLILSGASSTSSANADGFTITISGVAPITTGTYTIVLTGSPVLEPAMAYQQNGSASVYAEDVTGVLPISVTITSLSSTNIQGTFNGTLSLFSGTGPSTRTVTNGKFNINFK